MVESVGKTLGFISQGETSIYEATFLYYDVLAALDILVKDDEGWKAYEVKSFSKVSDTYIKDASIQYYTITNSRVTEHYFGSLGVESVETINKLLPRRKS